MSDRPDDRAPGDEGVVPPPPPPPVAIEPTATDTTVVRTGGLGARAVAIAVGAVLLVGGVAFAATQSGSSSDSPEDAVEELFGAMADEDLLGMMAALDPGERDTLSEPMQDLFAELERLEVVDDSFELTGIPGVDLEFDGLTFRTEPIIDGLARVHVTGGTASYEVDGAELPVGDFLADTLDRFGVEYASLSEGDAEEVATDGDDTFLVARDTGDGWRVSLGYTAAEAARLAAGKPVPATGMVAAGAGSPEAAVEGFLQAATELDVRAMVGLLSPDEFRALHHYWPVLVDETGIPTAADLGATVALVDLELDADVDGDRARVFVRSIGIDVTGDDFSAGGTIADGCVELRGDVRDELEQELGIDDGTICQDDLDDLVEEAMGDLDDMGVGAGGVSGLVPGADGELPTIGITTTKVDGQWYVAPIRTWADLGIAMLGTIEREDIEAMIDAVEDFFGGFTGMVGGGFVPPGLGPVEGFDDVEGAFEELGQIGDPIGEPGVPDARTRASLEGLALAVTGDEASAACVLAELDATATPDQLLELADAYDFDIEPGTATQQVLFAAMEACGG